MPGIVLSTFVALVCFSNSSEAEDPHFHPVGESLSQVQLFGTLWTVACQAPLSMEFSRQEYWSEFPFPSPGALPDPGFKPRFPGLQAYPLPSEPLAAQKLNDVLEAGVGAKTVLDHEA